MALARALATRPELLLLDEPFTGLDESRRRRSLSLLSEVRRRFGVPLVLVSHVPDEIVGVVERLRQRYGQLLRQAVARTVDTPEEVDAELRHLRVVLSG